MTGNAAATTAVSVDSVIAPLLPHTPRNEVVDATTARPRRDARKRFRERAKMSPQRSIAAQ